MQLSFSRFRQFFTAPPVARVSVSVRVSVRARARVRVRVRVGVRVIYLCNCVIILGGKNYNFDLAEFL